MLIKLINFDKLKDFIEKNKNDYIDLVYYNKEKIFSSESHIWHEKEFEKLINNFNETIKYKIKVKPIEYINKESNINEIDIDHYYLIKLRKIFYLIPYDVCETSFEDEKKIKQYDKNVTSLSLLDCAFDIKENKREIKYIKEDTEKEISELNNQLEKIKQDIQKKKEEMEEKISKLNDSIFILKSRLLKLRTFFGETFEIHQLRKGEKSSKKTPLIIYQKFRYLDEEMLKMSNATYDNWCVDDETICDFFSNNDEAFNIFCPTEKCITTFKNCSEKYYRLKDVYGKIVDEMEYWRADQVGFLIRDGENLYLVWVDEEITVKNDLFISNNQNTNVDTIDVNKGRLRSYETVLLRNRELLINIVNILILKEKLIELENINEETNIFDCNSIIFSSADNFIDDNRFPSLSNFVNNEEIKKGDLIITLNHIRGERYSSWGNHFIDTSYGDYKRGWNSSISGGTITKITIVEDNELYVKAMTEKWSRKKDDYNTRGVNILIYKSELIPLKNVTLDMVNYWIDTKNVGYNYNYVEIVQYLRKLKKYLLNKGKNNG